jgi:4-aminobutyrate aminotransferase-like enzyme
MTQPGRKEPNPGLAHDIVERCFHKGLLFFCPVGAWGQTIKIAPPLTIPQDAVSEGLAVLAQAVQEAVAALKEP